MAAVVHDLRATPDPRWIVCGPIALWPGRRLVRVADRIVALTPSESVILVALMEARGEPVSRRDLLMAIRRGGSPCLRSRVADMHVLSLRRKLEEDPSQPRIVVTVRNAGYAIEV